MAFFAGVAKHVITPYVGIGMEGNAREEGSRGVHDDLYARAIVLRNEAGQECAIVALDLCMLPGWVAARVRELICAQSPLQPEQVLVAATHTHAGPITIGIFGEEPDKVYLSEVAATAAGAVLDAYRNTVPAVVGFARGCAEEPVNNRRLRTADGVLHMNWEGLDPQDVAEVLGPTDPEIAIMRVDTPEGKPLATLINYALHPAILAGDNWLISADWPGYAIGVIEKLRGGMGLFLNGGTGNINHINYKRPEQKRGFYEAERLGTIVGCAAMEGLLVAEQTTDEATIQCAHRTVTVEGRHVSDEQVAEARALLAAHTGPLLEAATDGAPDALFASELVKLAERGAFTRDLEVQMLRIGDAAFFTFPGEVFVEYQLQVKQRNPLAHTFFVGYANDYQGYVPTPEALEQGGYEARPMSWSQFGPDTGQQLVDGALGLLPAE